MRTQDPVHAAQSGVASLARTGLIPRFTLPAELTVRLALLGLVLTTAVVAVAAAGTGPLLPQTTRPVPAWLSGPFGATGVRLGGWTVIALLVAMFGCYVAAVRAARQLAPRTLILVIAAVYALVLLAPPLFSTDLFSYQMYGRLAALHGINPYLAGPHTAVHDLVYPYVGLRWTYTPTVYGPLFTALSWVLAPLSVAASAFAYKGLAVLATLIALWLVWQIAVRRDAEPRSAVALVGLNPLVFLYGAGGGHNDLLMMVPVLAGVYFALRARPGMSGGMFVTAAAVKLVGGLPLVFALAADGRRSHAARLRMVRGAALTAAACAGLGLALFGGGLFHLPSTLGQVQGQAGGHSLANLIVKGLGLTAARGSIAAVLGALAAIACLWLLRQVWLGKLSWIAASGWASVALLLSTSWLVPWYAAWLLPFAAVGSDRRLWRVALLLSAAMLATNLVDYVPAGGLSVGP